MDYSVYMQFFVALLAIINPFGLLPVFIGLTSHQDDGERHRTALMAVVASICILFVVLLLGEELLSWFSISVASFQVAGGILLSFTSLSMLQGKLGEVRRTAEEGREAVARESVSLVPLALPLIAGPAAITTVIVYAQAHSSVMDLSIFGATIVAACFIAWLVFMLAPLLSKGLGTTGINVITRIMGLIMMALGVEFMARGLKVLFPVLG
ncbi:YchE family NAAT transporter [Gallaecimonas sp. GXIMD4217]|uniref:YchE family NAAT transporter n=1 Tax=Gallaecimonas sp. GXIMD4217 TaxID=3131927 RepID=UPI00311AD6B6